MTGSTAVTTTVGLHRLTMVPEDGGVMVGRPDIGSYAVFPPEGAEVLRRLDRGEPVTDVAGWYERTTGVDLDVEDFLAALADLQFLRPAGEDVPAPAPVRWQRLGRWAFSPPAWVAYVVLAVAGAVAMARQPELRPSYRHLFFTDHLALIPLILTAIQIPCILLHESFHALSGRRLGLPSRLRIGRRLYYLVAETRLDSLLSVPRKKRYLPFVAGMLADVVLISALTLAAAALEGSVIAALFLAIAFSSVLRLIWQFMFYLETDLYYVAATALRCSDLQNATRFYLRTRWRRLLRRPPPVTDADWTDRDRKMARWYAPLFVTGYAFSLGSLLWAGIPTTVRFWSTVVHRFRGSNTSTEAILDAVVFAVLTLANLGLLLYVAVRDRRATRTFQGA